MNAPQKLDFDALELHRMHVERRVLLEHIDALEHNLKDANKCIAAVADLLGAERFDRAVVVDLVRHVVTRGGHDCESTCVVCGARFDEGDPVRVAHHVCASQALTHRPVPPELDRAITDLLARLDARDDVGAATRLAIQAVRQELQATQVKP